MGDIRRRKAEIASSRRSHHDHRLPSPLKRKGRNRYSRLRLFEGKKGSGQAGRSYFAILGLNCSTYCV